MNITYLHQYFNTRSDPGGTRSYEFARRLVARGHAVHMVTSVRGRRDFHGWQEAVIDGIRVHTIPVPYSNAMVTSERIRAFLLFSWCAALRASRLSSDVVFATSTPLTIALPGAYAAMRGRTPMVFEVRDLWPEVPIALGAIHGAIPRWAAAQLERFAYAHATRVVALSPAMGDGVVRSGYPADRVHVIPNGSDLDLFDVSQELGCCFRARHTWLGDRPLVLYAGTLGMVNGVGYLVDVAHALQTLGGSVQVLVIGDGRQKSAVRQRADEAGVLNANFHMLPRIPKEEMPAVLSAATIATSTVIDVPELWSNSANKVFDAFAAGRPVAINHEGWQADLLRESGAGIVLPARDPARAAEMLHEFLSDSERLAHARQAARHLAETRFSRDLLFEEFERVLLLAAEEGRRR